MSKPTENYNWATDDDFDDPGEDWDTADTKVEPGPTGYREQGFLPARLLPADFLNWILNTLGTKWIGWLDARTDGYGTAVYPSGDRPQPVIKLGPHHWRPHVVSGVPDYDDDGNELIAKVNNARARLPLDHHLPDEGTIDTIVVTVKPNVVRATESNRIQVTLWRTDTTPGADDTEEQVGTTTSANYDDGTTDTQAITITPNHTFGRIDNEWSYYVLVTAGNNAGSNNDEIFGTQIEFTSHKEMPT